MCCSFGIARFVGVCLHKKKYCTWFVHYIMNHSLYSRLQHSITVGSNVEWWMRTRLRTQYLYHEIICSYIFLFELIEFANLFHLCKTNHIFACPVTQHGPKHPPPPQGLPLAYTFGSSASWTTADGSPVTSEGNGSFLLSFTKVLYIPGSWNPHSLPFGFKNIPGG